MAAVGSRKVVTQGVEAVAVEDPVTVAHLESLHSLFNKSYDLMSDYERSSAIRAKSSLDLQLVSDLDMVAVLIDLVMYGVQH